MVESHLKAGRQDLVPGSRSYYGQSIHRRLHRWEDSVPLLRISPKHVRSAGW